MKKSLVALAVLATTGAAFAQSSVTLFGIVDAGYARLSGAGASRTGITNSGLNSSRFGMRGTEDLGGGLKAGFHLEGQLSNDDGNAAGLNFQRRSYVTLSGGFGEVRIGREYTPTFWNTTVFDPFGTNGIGQAMSPGVGGGAVAGSFAAANNPTAVRSNNSITYLLPSGIGGVYGSAMVGFGEQASNAANSKQGNYFGFQIGYANGPLNVAGAAGSVKAAVSGNDVKTRNVGVSYNLGVVKPMFVAGSEGDSFNKTKFWEIGATAPLGVGELRAAYSRYDVVNSANDWNKFAVGYGHNLSKRTQLYTTYARVSNKGVQVKAVSNNGLAGFAAAGGNSTGFEAGVRHSF